MKMNATTHQTRQTASAALMAMVFVACVAVPDLAFAQDRDFEGQTCGFLGQITGLLSIASIAVVTIAIVFAGYQIAFAHKRMSDVAPILIGGLLIGGASQLAGWILGDNYGECDATSTSTGMIVQQMLQYVA
ncbi:TrbC/VirB2 family protein [Marilutibacter alkalisoli]|uniref:TrbC/VirB2 family protein n=1 Tax=Marilutibacter alkalisoli TaxID=2591633 RepID=A0A514BVL2_9GAMM|nr:TrbC/VirB2 family protein [Lysobacter alkalisoli]QDH71355.1 TrbC/VirB2 family protein [Lysobacter alkalisoli]